MSTEKIKGQLKGQQEAFGTCERYERNDLIRKRYRLGSGAELAEEFGLSRQRINRIVQMKRPKICAVIVSKDLRALRGFRRFIDLYEVRIDLIGDGWTELARKLKKPWIACNRIADEGGNWEKSEASRIEELLKATELGADIIDIELRTKNLAEIVPLIKRKARCLVSSHQLTGTPALSSLRGIVKLQLAAGADICKVVTAANSFDDNLRVLQLITSFPKEEIVSFAMGPLGSVSRILCPLVGGYFTYASIEEGKESASGQITVRDLRKIYEMVE